MTRSFRLLLVVVVVLVAYLASATNPAVAQTTVPVTSEAPAPTLPPLPDGVGSIIGPKPGQGVAPNDSGDRGGAAQLTLFVAIVAALGGGVLLVRRDMAKSRSTTIESP